MVFPPLLATLVPGFMESRVSQAGPSSALSLEGECVWVAFWCYHELGPPDCSQHHDVQLDFFTDAHFTTCGVALGGFCVFYEVLESHSFDDPFGDGAY